MNQSNHKFKLTVKAPTRESQMSRQDCPVCKRRTPHLNGVCTWHPQPEVHD